MFSRFFIERPIFANVIAIVTMLVGGVTLFALADRAISRRSRRRPSRSTTSYPGADAQVLADTVASPIEQEVNGVEDMLYMSSTCASDGSYTLTVTFEVGTDLDMAQVLVQNRVAIAQPQAARRRSSGKGSRPRSNRPTSSWSVALTSPDDRYDSLFLSNYATLRVKDDAEPDPGRRRHQRLRQSATTACGSGSTPRSSRPAT